MVANIVAPVEAQLAAYNAHDVDAFMRCYSADCAVDDGDGTRLPLSHARKDRSGTESLLWRLAGSLPPRFHTGPACRTFQACFTGFSTPLKFGRGGGKAQVRVRHACNPLPFALGLPATMSARCLGGIASRF